MNKHFSEAVTVFHGYRLPEEAVPVGYAALIDAYNLAVPFPYMLCAVSAKHRKTEKNGWRLFTPRHAPASFLEDNFVIFNIKGNSYRLVTRVAYKRQTVLIKWIGTHAEYSKKDFP